MRWDVIIAGGGLAGTALAANTSRMGLRTLLLEAGTPGAAGATAQSRGIVRVYDPQPTLMHKNLGGAREWQRIARTCPDIFNACGVLYLLRAEHVAAATLAIQGLAADDYPLQLIDRDTALQLFPQLNPERLAPGVQALWEPRGGYVNPRLAAQLFVAQTRQQGGEVLEGSAVLNVADTEQGVCVSTAEHRFNATVAVVAAGANSVTLTPHSAIFSRSIALSCVASGDSQGPRSCLIDERSGGYLRPESANFFFVGGATAEDAATPAELRWDLARANDQHLTLAQQLLTGEANALVDGREGFDGYTADFLPETHFLANSNIAVFAGFSGRGAKYIPDAARQFGLVVQERCL